MNTKIATLLQNRFTVPALVGAVAFSGGIGLGYIWGKSRGYTYVIQESDIKSPVFDDENQLELPWEENSQTVIMETFPAIDHLPVNYAHIVERIEDEVVEEVDQYDEGIPNVVNIFAKSADAEWDYEAELSTRSPDLPYVIHQEEFIADEMDFKQETLTYYAGDDMMADGADTPIYGYGGLMGELKFGHGSRDPNVVYIRNEKIHMEWEVLYHQGHFAQEVLGLEMEQANENELKHSVYKFRRE